MTYFLPSLQLLGDITPLIKVGKTLGYWQESGMTQKGEKGGGGGVAGHRKGHVMQHCDSAAPTNGSYCCFLFFRLILIPFIFSIQNSTRVQNLIMRVSCPSASTHLNSKRTPLSPRWESAGFIWISVCRFAWNTPTSALVSSTGNKTPSGKSKGIPMSFWNSSRGDYWVSYKLKCIYYKQNNTVISLMERLSSVTTSWLKRILKKWVTFCWHRDNLRGWRNALIAASVRVCYSGHRYTQRCFTDDWKQKAHTVLPFPFPLHSLSELECKAIQC